MEQRVLVEATDFSPAKPLVVAVIPAYNEERFIASVVITALSYADAVIVVDDGSTDRTASLARVAGADVVVMEQNGGKGRALNAGFQRARMLKPDAVVMLDGDAQHEPSEIPRLTQPILDGQADVVVGSRFLCVKSDIPQWRQAGQHMLNAATNSMSQLKLSDTQSGYRAFSLAALDIMRFQSNGLAVESEMQFLLERTSLQVAEVPISVQYLDGNKRNPVAHGMQIIDAMLRIVARRRPLLYLGAPGFLMTVVGLILGISILQVVEAQQIVPLGRSILCAIFILSGLVFSVTGVILNSLEHFMTRMHREFRSVIDQMQPVAVRQD